MNPFFRYSSPLLLLVTVGLVQGQFDAPTDTAFREQIQRLDPRGDKAERLKALGWINANSRAKNADLAIPALERCIRDDPEWEVRQKAVLDLGLIAKSLDRPCPPALLEAIHDREDFVRYQAFECAALFKTFTPGSLEVLLRGVKAENAELRSSSLLLLPRVAGQTPQTLDAIEQATKDRVFDVRHCAHIARFQLRNKLDEHLPYLIRMREDPASVLSPVPEDSEIGKQERQERNLILIGIAIQMIEWSDSRTEELADTLRKLLADTSPIQRRGAVNLIGATAVKVELRPQGSGIERILSYLDPPPPVQPNAPPEKSKVAARLEKLGIEAALRKLQETDPDSTVRDAATTALKRLASVKGK